MTYREILEEFDKRRLNPPMMLNPATGHSEVAVGNQIDDLQWAIQSILEKLAEKEEREKEKGATEARRSWEILMGGP